MIKNKRTTIGKGLLFKLRFSIRNFKYFILGYGFVVFQNMNDAMASIKALHNMPYKGRHLQVRFRV